MRCPDCNKFVSLENEESPEVEPSVEVDSGRVSIGGTVSLVRVCADCSTELKSCEAGVDDEASVEIPKEHLGEGHDMDVEIEVGSVDESGGARYKKNIITANLSYTMRCSCQKREDKPLAEGDLTASAAAGEFEELV